MKSIKVKGKIYVVDGTRWSANVLQAFVFRADKNPVEYPESTLINILTRKEAEDYLIADNAPVEWLAEMTEGDFCREYREYFHDAIIREFELKPEVKSSRRNWLLFVVCGIVLLHAGIVIAAIDIIIKHSLWYLTGMPTIYIIGMLLLAKLSREKNVTF